MHPSIHAQTSPSKPAIIMGDGSGSLTYEELNARSNQAAQLYRAHGLKPGDCAAFFLENSPAFFELIWGAQRAGLLFACISTKLSAGEAAYIVGDSGAKMLFASPNLADAARGVQREHPGVACFSVGGAIEGFAAYESARDQMPAAPVADETSGADLLYSSGTTGRPKGVKRDLTPTPIEQVDPLTLLAAGLYGIGAHSVYLSPAPLYHAAPLRWCMSVHRMGGTTVIMPKFDPETYLALVEQHRVTESQLVPTMFVRMLKLPPDTRAKYDVSSLRMAVHAAAPCPIPVKEQMIEWWGPVIHEYYAGTEGNGFCTIDSAAWLAKKGSVGKAMTAAVHICDDEGRELPAGESGTIYFEGAGFEYHNDPKKTAESRHPGNSGWSTLGDVGYLDEDGFLFLTDRKAFMIISGGVNIYPQEIENLLVTHPKVADAAVFGVPNEDFGEEVKAVIQPMEMAAAGPELEAELIGFCRQHLSHIKCPRSVDFMEKLPRHPTGKLYKRLLRDRYWGNRDSRIV